MKKNKFISIRSIVKRSIAMLLCSSILLSTAVVSANASSSDSTTEDFKPNSSVTSESKIDFSSKRLLVHTSDAFIFTEDTQILSEYDNMYLVEFETEELTEIMYHHYQKVADFVDPDIMMYVADDDFVEDESTESIENIEDNIDEDDTSETEVYSEVNDSNVNNINDDIDNDVDASDSEIDGSNNESLDNDVNNESDTKKNEDIIETSFSRLSDLLKDYTTTRFSIALIDTGSSSNSIDRVSIIGSDISDDNGHGDAMLSAIQEINKDLSILSIKTFDENGKAHLSDVYAAIEYAIASQADVICLPFSSKVDIDIKTFDYLQEKAQMANVVMIASAGNKGENISNYVPANTKGIYIVGACDEEGNILPTSNYGSNLFANVVANSTSEAAAKLSAYTALWGLERVKFEFGKNDIFSPTIDKEDNNFENNDNLDIENDGAIKDTNKLPLVEIEETPDNPLLNDIVNSLTNTIDGDFGAGITRPAPENKYPEQTAVSADGQTIKRIAIRWLSSNDGSAGTADYGRLSLAPFDSKVTDQHFQIEFFLEGQSAYEPGDIQLAFPAYLWKDRNNKEPGILELSVPEDPETGAIFAYRRSGDMIYITNTKKLASTNSTLIQGSFRNVYAPDMINGTLSQKFLAKLIVKTPNKNEISMESNWIDAIINTKADAINADKTAYDSISKNYTTYWETPDNLPSLLKPDDADKYMYVRWFISGRANGSQSFIMSATDTISNQYGGKILGATGTANGIIKATNDTSITVDLFNGYSNTEKTAYIWTAYLKSAIPNNSSDFTLSNNLKITVTEKDTGRETTKNASASVIVKSPTTYTFIKHWDDNNNATGRRPQQLRVYIYDKDTTCKTIYLNAENHAINANDWVYTWSDNGEAGHEYTVDEENIQFDTLIDEKYDTDGNRYAHTYKYVKTTTLYDPATHTWTYTNKYREDYDVPMPLPKLEKKVSDAYDDIKLDSNENSAINQLRRGQSIIVPYYISTTLSNLQLSPNTSSFILEDNDFKLNEKSVSVDDLDIAYVILSDSPKGCHWVNQDSDGLYEWTDIENLTETLYAKIDDTYIAVATIQNGNIEIVPNSGASLSGYSQINLPSGVSSIKTEVNANANVILMQYTLGLRVNPTNNIKNMIEEAFNKNDYILFELYNQAHGYVTSLDTNKTTLHKYDYAIGYLHGRNYHVAVDMNKEFVLVDNDVINRRVLFHSTLTLTQQSNITNSTEYKSSLDNSEIPNTRSGIYYDLLPWGVSPDISSIKTINREIVTNAYTIPNYRGSGRTLLIVYVNLVDNVSFEDDKNLKYDESTNYPQKGYKNTHTLEFDSWVSWDSIIQNGLDTFYNVAAYRADEDELGDIAGWSGEPDNPIAGNNINSASAIGNNANLMTGLNDIDNDEPAFVYSGAKLVYQTPVIMSIVSLWKLVQAEGTGLWSDGLKNEVNVPENGLYTYEISMRPDTNEAIKDIILIDSIENFVPDETNPNFGDVQWNGTFKDIDVSALTALGIKPIIYYSTVPKLDVSGVKYNPEDKEGVVLNHLLTDEYEGKPVWSTTRPEDLSTITAIAIDASKKVDNSDFILEQDQMLSIRIYMQAPYDTSDDDKLPDYFKNTNGSDYLQNGHAYNNAYIDYTHALTTSSNKPHTYFSSGYTKVGIFTKVIEVNKIWNDKDDVDGLRPNEIKIILVKDGVDTDNFIILNETTNWKGSFNRYKTYDDDGKFINYTVREEFDNSEAYTSDISKVEKDGITYITLTNNHENIKTNITVNKTWVGDNNNSLDTRPSYIIVKLFANDEFTGKQLTIRPDTNGNWSGSFYNLDKNYNHGTPIKYTIEEEFVENYKWTATSSNDSADTIDLVNEYYPYGDLTIKKITENITDAALNSKFTFDLILTDSNGKSVINEYKYTIYNEDGKSSGITGEISNGGSFELLSGQYIVIKDINTGINYEIIENLTPGFIQSNATNNKGIITSRGIESVFTNTYSSKGFVQLSVNKNLTGHEISDYQFKFLLSDSNDNVIKTAYNTGETAIFGRITFTEADNKATYTYYISEVDLNHPGYTYDSAIYTVKVYVYDNGNGTMSCDVTYFSDEEVELNDIPMFNNSYHASGSLGFKAWKEFKGTLTENQFQFELYDEDFNLLQTVGNTLEGDIQFSNIDYNETHAGKTYFYFLREKNGNDSTVVYDESILIYVVVVTDNNDGTLSFSQRTYDGTDLFEICSDCNGNDNNCNICKGFGKTLKVSKFELSKAITPVFNNGLQPGNLSITKYTTGDNAPDTEFRFKLTLVGDGIEDANIEYAITNVGNNLPDYINNYTSEAVEKSIKEIETEDKSSNENNIKYNNPIETKEVDDVILETTKTKNSQYSIMPIASIVASGTSGTISWTLDSDGLLTIQPSSGTSGTFDNMSRSPWDNYTSSIKQVDIIGDCYVQSGKLFYNCRNLTTINNISNIKVNTSNSLTDMFALCFKLSSLDLSDWDVSNVIDMSGTFRDCNSLTLEGISSWDVGHVTNMSNMFNRCTQITSFDLSDWDVSHVNNMSNMFSGCSKLTSLEGISSWDVSHVNNMSNMFSSCGINDNCLDSISDWNVSNVTSMSYMFSYCSNITSLDAIRGWTVSNVIHMSDMFNNCSKLASLDGISQWNVSNVRSMGWMFRFCYSITSLDAIKNWNVGNVTNMERMFEGCSKLTSLDAIKNWNVGNVTNMERMFEGCSKLTSLDAIKNWNVGNVTNISRMFYNCKSLISLDAISDWDVSNVTNFSSMIGYCTSLTSLDAIKNWNVKYNSIISGIFSYCEFNLSDINMIIDSWGLKNFTNMGGMFSGCINITSLDLSDWDVSNVTDMSNMFSGCNNLVSLNLSNWNATNVRYMDEMFDGCESLVYLNLSGFTTSSKLRDIDYMFYNCRSLVSLDLYNFDTSGIEEIIDYPFSNCTSLSEVIVSDKFFASEDSYVRLPTPPKTNHCTGTWVLKDNVNKLDATTYTPAQLYNAIRNNPSLSGVYVWYYELPYTVTFTANEGSGAMNNKNYYSDMEATLPTCEFVRNLYACIGWYDSINNKTFMINEDGVAIIPPNTYNIGDSVTLQAIWEYNAHPADFTNGSFEFILHGGEQAQFGNIPAGTAYQVWEETPSGWVLVKQVNTTGVIQPLETSKAVLVNDYQPDAVQVSLNGIKTLDGIKTAVDNKGNIFSFQLIGPDNDTVQTVGVQPGGFIKFDPLVFKSTGTFEYVIKEVVGDNTDIQYDTHEEHVTIKITNSDSGILVASIEYDNDEILFENRTFSGNLEISKTSDDLTDTNKDTIFYFAVNFFNSNGIPMTNGNEYQWYVRDASSNSIIDISDELDNLIINSTGELIVGCKIGQKIIIPDLPIGVIYSVEEINLPNGWSISSISGENGSIQAKITSSVTVDNSYSAIGYANIIAHKKFNGNTLESSAFEFELSNNIDFSTIIETVYNGPIDTTDNTLDESGDTIPNIWINTAPIVFNTLEFTNSGNYNYYIREVKGNDNSIIYDEHIETVIIHVTDNGDGTLKTIVEYDTDGALFTNNMKPGNLTVNKVLQNGTNAANQVDFQFAILLKDSSGNSLVNEYKLIKSDKTEIMITNNSIVSIKADESFTIYDLPHGCQYEIVELDSDGFTLLNSSNSIGIISGGETKYAEFTNIYSSRGELVIEAFKEFIGGEILANTFSFNLLNSDGEIIETIYANIDGTIKFTPIDFTTIDDGTQLVYFITENVGEDKNIIYDTHTETVVVNVIDNGDGTISFDTKYDDDGAVFTNYASYNLEISKFITGNMGNKNDIFDFELILNSNEIIELPETLEYNKSNEYGPIMSGTISQIDGKFNFTLGHGESIVFNIPMSTNYTIIELDDEYTTTIEISDETIDDKIITRTLDEDTSIVYNNSKIGYVPTDATTNYLWLIPLFGISILAITAIIVKRRRKSN